MFLPYPGWHWLPAAAPHTQLLLLGMCAAAAVMVTIGLLCRLMSVVTLACIMDITSITQDPNNQTASLLCQLAVLNCCIQLNR